MEPVLYDPSQKKKVNPNPQMHMQNVPQQILHHSEPGSLLKIWGGKLDLLSSGNRVPRDPKKYQ